MKQLKFNSDKDMKELEKYGFKEANLGLPAYILVIGNYHIKIYKHDGLVQIDISSYDYYDLLIILYDLIKANLLIVEEKDD